MRCSKCGAALPPGMTTCFACGHPTGEAVLVARAVGTPPRRASFCSQCGRALGPSVTVCAQCGARVADLAYGDPQAKSKVAAGLLGLFLGAFGVHRFYLGYSRLGILQIIVTIVTCSVGGLWGAIEGILILAGVVITKDAEGRALKD